MIGVVLKEARHERGLSLGALAQKARVHKSTLSRWESGRTTPHAHELVQVLDALTASDALRESCSRFLTSLRAQQQVAPAMPLRLSGGELLRSLRLRSGMTQQAAAHALGITQALISKWENNSSWPDSHTLTQLCRVLKATPAEHSGLTTRAWVDYTELPDDPDALDALLTTLEGQPHYISRDLYYLALASRYNTLYQARRISADHAQEVWGYLANHLIWNGQATRAYQITLPYFTRFKNSRDKLSSGQTYTLYALTDALTLWGLPERALAILWQFEDRIPDSLYWRWLDEVSQKASHAGNPECTYTYQRRSIDCVPNLKELCFAYGQLAERQCLFGDAHAALKTLETAPHLKLDLTPPYCDIQYPLTRAIALCQLGERQEASMLLNQVLPKLEAKPYPTLIKVSQRLVHTLNS